MNVLFWTNPASNIPQSSNCTATCLPFKRKYIRVRTRIDVRHCWRRMDEFKSDVFLWTPAYRRASVGRPPRTHLHQHWADIGYRWGGRRQWMIGKNGERERERENPCCQRDMMMMINLSIAIFVCMYVCKYVSFVLVKTYVCMYVSIYLFITYIDMCRLFLKVTFIQSKFNYFITKSYVMAIIELVNNFPVSIYDIIHQ